MKNFVSILLLFSVIHSSFAQDQNERKNEFGVNVNIILDKIISDNENNPDPIVLPSNHLLGVVFRHNYSNKHAFKIGLGYYHDVKRDSFISGSFFQRTKQKLNFVGLQFGIQRNILISSRIKPYVGFDFIYRRKISKVNHEEGSIGIGFSWNQEYEDKTIYNQYGLSMPIGIQIYLTNRISISTESNLEALYEFSINEYSQNVSNERKANAQFFNWNIPTILFLNFRF